MGKKNVLTKGMVFIGDVLVAFPILATLLTSVVGSIDDRVFRFDYLMPMELFPFFLVGGGLLLLAAFRMRSFFKLIGWGFAAALVLMVGSQAIAVVTGLASGETETGGWQWALVMVGIIGYWLANIEVAMAGVLLGRKLLQKDQNGIKK